MISHIFFFFKSTYRKHWPKFQNQVMEKKKSAVKLKENQFDTVVFGPYIKSVYISYLTIRHIIYILMSPIRGS